jgi:hypothetical protein
MAKAQAQEPSMEEILASIRRIIADEEPAPAAKAAAPKPAPEAETVSEDDLDRLFAAGAEAEDDEPLELTSDFEEPFEMVEGPGDDADVTFADPEPEPPPPPPKPVAKAPQPQPAPPPQPAPAVAVRPAPAPIPAAPEPLESRIMSEATDMAVHSAFNNLALTIMSNQSRTLEDLVKEMLRPMLKGWLDENLPSIVERMVRAEIERVARGGR